jgi:hypothetical protein
MGVLGRGLGLSVSGAEKVSSPIPGCASGFMVICHELCIMGPAEKFSISEYNSPYCPSWFGNNATPSQTYALTKSFAIFLS